MQDKYTELTIHVNEPFVELVADFVANVTDEGVEMGRDRVIVRSEHDIAPILQALETLDPAVGVRTDVEEKENIDWIQAYQDSIQPIEAGRFYVHPEWYPPMEEKISILINPALAFGSGHHATTFTCLEAISERVHEGQHVLDVGCGSGILALAARKLGASVELCDVDPLSVQSATENFTLNGETPDKIWEGSANQADGTYDIVIANIIADVLRALSAELKRTVSDGGTLILSGILDTKESIVTDAFQDLTLIERKQRDEWVTLIYTKG
jgi:ribosomal protein L11 methyltransferase